MDKVRLGDIATLINGDRGKNYPSQADITDEGDIPFVNAGHLNGRSIDFEEMNYISQEKYDCLSSGKFIKGDVLYCLRGSLGKKAIVNDDVEGAIASSLVIIRPDYKRIDGDYLMFSLDSPSIKEQLIKANNGSSQPNLSAASVREYQIELPDMQIQKAVVEKLAKVREAIDNRQCELDLLDLLIKARFVEMFGGQEFERKQLIDLIQEGAGLSYGIVVPGDNVDDGIPMVRPSDFKNGRLNLDNVYRVALDIECKYKKTRLLGDEILVQVIGQPGQVMLSDERCKGMNVTRNLAVIRIDKNKADRLFISHYLTTEEAQRFMFGSTNQSTLKQLPLNKLKELPVPMVPISEQVQFADFVKQVDKSKVAVQKALDETQTLFDSLMHEYFG
ncbi:restriction endonuclease subunit S [Butyrivibrio sp. NC2002]|uniref:restriction endonuclease subunit S n=1 Tax=Butyrivibrio sp. NC2002 TaxID=1410610 RepID=UPI000568B8A9|nr:restriction endonuclease subunit S [Butyrivibrio sp. NC2002]